MTKIEIPIVNLKCQKPTEVISSYLVLEKDYVKRVLVMFADEPVDEEDPELGWKNEFTAIETIAFKKNIAGIIKQWNETSKKWGVTISLFGFNQDIAFYFKKESEADELMETLFKYIIEPPCL